MFGEGGQTNGASSSKVAVLCRIRSAGTEHIAHAGTARNTKVAVIAEDESSGRCTCLDPLGYQDDVQFSFDAVLGPDSSQSHLFNCYIVPHLPAVRKGFHVTVFAYGATGSGKTHTIMGPEGDPGVIQRSIQWLLEQETGVQATSDSGKTLAISMSFLEVYSAGKVTKIVDLMRGGASDLCLREGADRVVQVAGLSQTKIESCNSFLKAFKKGQAARKTGATSLNRSSSRSHAVLTITLKRMTDNGLVEGKLNLIDLAGNEDNRKTSNSGVRMAESCGINQSLFALGKVINSLNSGAQHIPYRDSVLTRMLQQSLGGRNKAIMLACVSPSGACYQASFNTLSYASKAKTIQNKTQVVAAEVEEAPILAKSAGGPITMEDRLKQWRAGRKRISSDSCDSTSSGGNSPQIKRVDLKKQRMSSSYTLHSPYTKSRKVKCSDHTSGDGDSQEVLRRVEALERKLKGVASSNSKCGSDAEENIIDSVLTPGMRQQSLKTHLTRGKERQLNGDITGALESFRRALLLEDHPKIRARIEKLEKQLGNKNIDSTTALGISASSRANVQKTEPVEETKRKLHLDAGATGLNVLDIDEKSWAAFDAWLLDVFNFGGLDGLTSLKGVGKQRAGNIMAHREEIRGINGGENSATKVFSQLEDLKSVGISEKMVTNIRRDTMLSRIQLCNNQ